MKKRILSSLLALVLLVCFAIPAHAEEISGGSSWRVEFNGDKIDANFGTAALTEAVKAIEPGDQVTISVALKNVGESASNWYMTNEVLQSLEDSQSVANGGAYSYTLRYVSSTGEVTTLFDSDSVGGEKDSESGEGLHEVTDSLSEFFYLDTLGAASSGTVELIVALDGETQGNEYQDTLARLQMNFAAEKSDNNNTPGTPGTPGRPGSTGLVQTGDDTNLVLWSAMMVGSGALAILLIILGIKERKEQKKGGDLSE